jgi:hypothetical protein
MSDGIDERRRKQRETTRRWRERHPERSRESNHRWQTERREDWLAAKKRKRERTVDERKDYRLRRLYGITKSDYDAMYAEQAGCCAICGRGSPVLHVDHDHTTGGVRALLCSRCNTALGLFGESPDVLRAALRYLGSFSQEVV